MTRKVGRIMIEDKNLIDKQEEKEMTYQDFTSIPGIKNFNEEEYHKDMRGTLVLEDTPQVYKETE